MKQMMKDAAILFAITLISGLLLGIVYQVTKDPIAKQNEKQMQAAGNEVFTEADHFEDLNADGPTGVVLTAFPGQTIEGAKAAYDEAGTLLGYVITVTTHEGFNGDIQFMMGVKNDGTLNGISILQASESPGLGARADEVLKPQFAGKNVASFEYTKTGATTDAQIDAISGATITTNAGVNGVNAGVTYFTEVPGGGSSNE